VIEILEWEKLSLEKILISEVSELWEKLTSTV
jgi:hypothetical protein